MVLRVNVVVVVNVSGEKREEESLWSFHQQTRNHNKWQRHTPGSWQTPEEELRNVFQWFRNRTWNVCFDSAPVTLENYWEHRKSKSNSSLISWTLNSTQSCLRELTQNLEDSTFLPGLDSVFLEKLQPGLCSDLNPHLDLFSDSNLLALKTKRQHCPWRRTKINFPPFQPDHTAKSLVRPLHLSMVNIQKPSLHLVDLGRGGGKTSGVERRMNPVFDLRAGRMQHTLGVCECVCVRYIFP